MYIQHQSKDFLQWSLKLLMQASNAGQKGGGVLLLIPRAGVLRCGFPYKSFENSRWLYIGLKQLETEWKPAFILSRQDNHGQKIQFFLTQATKFILEITSSYDTRLPLH